MRLSLRSPRVRQGLPASYATVLRRGGFLSPSHRHGSPRTERGESTGPKPCWWLVGRPGDCALPSCRDRWGRHVQPLLADRSSAIVLILALLRACCSAYRRRQAAKAMGQGAAARRVELSPVPAMPTFKHEVIRTSGPLKPQHRRLVAARQPPACQSRRPIPTSAAGRRRPRSNT